MEENVGYKVGIESLKTLIIAEKPDMGRNIAAAIEPKAKNNRTHLEGEQYVITWAIGHLIELAEPDKYDDKFKKWNFADLPIIPETFKLLPNPRTKDQLGVIRDLAKRCDKLVNACDAGREGQHIFSLIQRHLGLRQPVRRLWISDLTPETIRNGFANLRDGADFESLTKAARARSEADWLVGMNGSRAFTTKHNELLSVGRVQTPVLALIYDRQREIEAFTSATYYEVEAVFEQPAAPGTTASDVNDEGRTVYTGKWTGGQLADKGKAEAIAAKVQGKPGRIAGYEVKDTKEYPFKLYDLTLLQREANAKLGFSAKKTLDIAQALYEKHKVISYPRTNSNYVNEQNIPEMHRALDALKGTAYDDFVRDANRSFVHKNNKYVCNPAKVEDHHAILPTNKRAGALSADEQSVYDLIVRRFLSQFYAPAEYKLYTVLTEVEQETFKTTVKQLISLGWKVLYPDQRNGGKKTGGRDAKRGQAKETAGGADKGESDAGGAGGESDTVEVETPFSLDPESPVLCAEAAAKEKETQPPKPYTEGTLLKAMESAGKQIEDDELRDAMKDAGLGTPATRAATIERLKQVGYIVMQGKRITVTTKGRTAIELIRGAGVELLTSPEMTGHWERRLNEIAKGSASDSAFMDNVKRFVVQIIDKVRVQPRAERQSFESAAAARGGKGSRGGPKAAGAAGGAKARATGGRSASSAAGSGARASAGGASGATARSAGASVDAARTARSAAPNRAGNASTASAAAAGAGAPGGDAAAARTAPAFIADCPRQGCGGRIFLGRKGYGCSNYRTGCRFVVWKNSLGKSISEAMIRSLIEKGRTGKLKFSGKSGDSYEAHIVLKDRNSGAIELERV